MTPDESHALCPRLIGWIRATLAAHEQDARAVGFGRICRLPRYFSDELLASAAFVAVDRVPRPPFAALGLSRFAAFALGDRDGITYLDTFCVQRRRATDEGP